MLHRDDGHVEPDRDPGGAESPAVISPLPVRAAVAVRLLGGLDLVRKRASRPND
jgi:hypothetical protein